MPKGSLLHSSKPPFAYILQKSSNHSEKTVINQESEVIFNGWHFSHRDGYLKRQDVTHKLPPRLSKLLSLLTSQAGQLVERNVIIEELWSGKVVNDDALARCIAELRSILGDKSQAPIYIETIPRRGYRFIAELKPEPKGFDKKILALIISGAVILTMAIYWWLQQQPKEDHIDWRHVIAQSVRVTAEAEMEIQPELSSNGRSLSYSIKENEAFVIKVVDLSGAAKFHISATDAHLLSPVLSPKEDRLLAIEYSDNGCEVVLFALPELSKQALSECALPNPSGALEWTKEGDGFVFVKSNNNQLSTSIWLYNLLTNTSKQLTTKSDPDLFDTRPRISPDGQSLSFQRGTGSIQNIYVQALDDPSTVKQITFDKSRKMSHQWSEKSDSLLFDSNVRGDKNLWLVNLNDQQIENLGAKDGQHPMLSDDGKIFAYQEARYQANLWLHDINEGSKKSIVASPKYDNHPAYAPNGQSIAFSTNKHGYSAIWLFDMALQQQRLVLSIEDKSLFSPHWSPSGKKLLISAMSEQGYQCFELTVETGLFKQVKNDETPITSCIYLTEQQILAITKHQGQAAQAITIFEDGTINQHVMDAVSSVRPVDDQTYIYTKSHQKGLFQYSVSKQNSDVLIANYPKTFYKYWDIRNKNLYYIHPVKNDQLWVFDFTDQSHQKVLESVNVAVGGVISVSPDETQIVLSEKGHNQGNIFVTELDSLN
jgi:Tol biopolymer transport system component/DNA-binding winged helix-turn-helix (wHTH) protein